MAEERAPRRLAAILAADVVGYSRLIEQDEAGTLRALKQRHTAIIAPLLAAYDGRIAKLMGDGLLVEFASAVDAVACAVELQEKMTAANENLAHERHVLLRIGINLGDVVVENGDLLGDSVNIAARLQTMADPGGICMAGSVHDQIGNRLPLMFEDLGTCELKNIARPVRAFRVRVDSSEGGGRSAKSQPALTKPSIAVLPFTNLSGDREQQYYSDGISEDIITGLSRFRSLLVIARNSSFQYRDRPVDVRTIARELGVQYVVEGSVRKVENHVRISAQLIDAKQGIHLWAEQFDRELPHLFAVQDEVTQTIVATLEGRVAAGAAAHARRKPTADMDAYDYVLQARHHMAQYDLAAAEPLLARAIEADPLYAEAHARAAFIIMFRYWTDHDTNRLNAARKQAQKALALDAEDEWAHLAMGNVCLSSHQFDLSESHYQRALALNPNSVSGATIFAELLGYVGRMDEALQRLDDTMRRDPFPPSWYWEIRGQTLFQLQRYEDAIKAFNCMTTLHPWNHAYLAAAYAHAGKFTDAIRQLGLYGAEGSGPSLAEIAAAEPYEDKKYINHLTDGLQKAESAGRALSDRARQQ